MKKIPQILIVDLVLVFVLWIILILCAGCTTQKKVTRFLNENETFSNRWFSEHYGFDDSVGEKKVVYIPAENKDYSSQIDSMASTIDSQMAALQNKKVDSNCLDDITEVKNNYSRLLRRFRALQQAYKPCIPDTVFVEIPHYMSSKADKARIEALKKKNAVLEADQKADKTEIKLWKSRLFMGVAILVLLIGASFLINRLNIFKFLK